MYQRAITPKLKPQYQSSTVLTTEPTQTLASLIPGSSVFTNQLQGESTQDARTVLSSVGSWSDRRNSSPTPPLDNTAPSFMRDTMITRAAERMSDMQLFATDTVVSAPPTTQASEVVAFQDRSSNQQRTQPADPWKARTTSSSSGHGAPTLDDNDNSTPNRHNGSDICDIQFGLSPNAEFDRAENRGSYREFENRNDEGIQRGFEFRLDANRGNNHSSATPSDCSDDYNSSNGEDEDHSSNDNSH